MAKYGQSSADRMDESLGMRRGKESSKMQSYKDRRDESRGMKGKDYGMGKKAPHKADYHRKGFDLKDNAQAATVKSINTNSEQYDIGRMKKLDCGSRGYPAEAWNYKY